MVNFGLLTAEICWRVWGTPANFNGFRVLAALLHGTLVMCVSQTTALNRGRYLYLAGRPSLWALAHILVYYFLRSNLRGRRKLPCCTFARMWCNFIMQIRGPPIHFEGRKSANFPHSSAMVRLGTRVI